MINAKYGKLTDHSDLPDNEKVFYMVGLTSYTDERFIQSVYSCISPTALCLTSFLPFNVLFCLKNNHGV